MALSSFGSKWVSEKFASAVSSHEGDADGQMQRHTANMLLANERCISILSKPKECWRIYFKITVHL